MKTKITILLFGTASFLFITNVSKAQGFSVSGTNTYTNPLANLVGIGTSTPLGTLDVLSAINSPSWTYFRGNVNATKPSTSFSSGGLAIGWNYTAGGGEVDFVSNKTDGTVGGFRFQDWTTGGSGTITDLMTIKGDGNVGIGTTSPSAILEIKKSNPAMVINSTAAIADASILIKKNGTSLWAFGSNVGNSTENFQFYNYTTGTVNLSLNQSTGYVGIGTTSPSDILTVAGNVVPSADNSYKCGKSGQRWTEIWAVNGTIQTSDIKYKKNIEDLKYGINEIMQLRPVTYRWKENDNGKRIGLIAQEIKSVIGEVVIAGDDKDKNLGVIYTELIPVLIKGIQEQQQKIDSLQSKANKQDTINAVLQNQLNLLLERENGYHIGASSQSLNQTDVRLTDMQTIVLEQNVPNPFAEQTAINYSLSDNTVKAQILFYNSQGKLIQSTELTQKGKGTLNVFASDLSNGIYTYTLVVDGKIIETKKMVKQ